MTREEAEKLGISMVGGVVFHTSRHRGTVAIKRNVQDNRVYYVFKHEKRPIAIREEEIFKAFKEE